MSKRSSIGGLLDYRVLANFHRPVDHAAVVQEVQRLHRNGLPLRDIGAALGLDHIAVLEILGPQEAVA